jgi:hypothetical protein
MVEVASAQISSEKQVCVCVPSGGDRHADPTAATRLPACPSSQNIYTILFALQRWCEALDLPVRALPPPPPCPAPPTGAGGDHGIATM